MAYTELNLPEELDQGLKGLIRGNIEIWLKDIHQLLVGGQSPEDHSYMPHSIALLLLSVTDGVATLFYPYNCARYEKFEGFLLDNFPWQYEFPEGTSKKAFTNRLWKMFRNPLIHSLAMTAKLKNNPNKYKIGFSRIHSNTSERLEEAEKFTQGRYYSSLSLEYNENKKLWVMVVEQYYLSLRQSIINAVNNGEKTEKIKNYLSKIDLSKFH